MKFNQLIKVKLLMLLFGINMPFKSIKKVFGTQISKGIDKYGKSLKQCDYNKYDWKVMALEELVDFIQYVYKLKGKL